MTIVYIHGLGGQGGDHLGRSIGEAARVAGHRLVALRWGAGRLNQEVGKAVVEAAREILPDPNLLRAGVRFGLILQQRTGRFWDSALANLTEGCQLLVALMRRLEAGGDEFSIIGFSLGGRLLLTSLRQFGPPAASMRHAVFAGAAVSIDAFSALPRGYFDDGRIINVFSSRDSVLRSLYPRVHGLDKAAGVTPVAIEGMINTEVDAGHLTYHQVAERLVQLAVRGAAA